MKSVLKKVLSIAAVMAVAYGCDCDYNRVTEPAGIDRLPPKAQQQKRTQGYVSNVPYGTKWIDHGYGFLTKVVEIEGHRYILVNSRDGHIVHAASCPCMSKGEKE